MAPTDQQALHPVLARQMTALGNRDLDALMDNYLPDAALLRHDGAAVGTAALRELLAAYLALEPDLVDLTWCVEAGDTVFYRATMLLGGAPAHTFGTLVLRHGKIWRQTVGVVATP